MPILTAKVGTNADLFPDILKLYSKEGQTIADVTYGKGVFWKKVDTSKYDFQPSDITTGINLTKLPYLNESIDLLVLDPPYAHTGSTIKRSIERQYNLNMVNGREQIRNLYKDGIIEAKRVLKDGGLLIIKCQDEIEWGKQYWNHLDIMMFAFSNGFIGEDLFILVQNGTPTMRHNFQHHARKNHSYFIVLRKKKRVVEG